MKKDRVAGFTDAVLANIMTILVLELEKPFTINLRTFWELRHSFLSYTLSFFWLGSMWVNFHNKVAQGFYGLFVLGVTLSNVWLSHVIESSNDNAQLPVEIMKKRRQLLVI